MAREAELGDQEGGCSTGDRKTETDEATSDDLAACRVRITAAIPSG
jgi:hypothetical protein